MRQENKAVCTIVLIGINVAVFIILSFIGRTEDAEFMVQYGAMYEPYIIEGQEYYRFITSMFLHFGIDHIMNNMVMLGALGWNLEIEIGRIRFLSIYLLSGLAGNVLSLWMNMRAHEFVVSAGASGAVFGLMGALLYVVTINKGRMGRITKRGMLFMLALSLYFGFTSAGVDNWAHVGGLVSGFVLAVVLYRNPRHRAQA